MLENDDEKSNKLFVAVTDHMKNTENEKNINKLNVPNKLKKKNGFSTSRLGSSDESLVTAQMV